MLLNLKPSSAKVRDYYSALNQLGQLNISHEMAVRSAFASLLDSCAKRWDWTLVPEFRISLPTKKSVIVDGAVFTAFKQRHGYWEAKDLKDDLEKEVKRKLDLGYPKDNIIFQSPERAILYQNGMRQSVNEDITSSKNLVDLLERFFDFRKPHEERWEEAVKEFSPRIPEIAAAAKELIDKERRTNKNFVAAFAGFVALCRQAINPNLSEESVETMLIQHLLTERIFRKVFNNAEFTRRNIIAGEIEKVIDSLTSRHFSRDAFLKDLDYFYRAIEDSAKEATDYSEKQSFLNTVYERFFQGFSKKEADTHGIVYTPQPIVNFMVRSVEEILKKEFGKSLSDREVHILDPFVGTGNFIVRVMQEIRKTALAYKYANELHCNEVMLLPYYIASMNIEHAYVEATDEYKPFEGICLVDTFELAEQEQASLFTAENTARVEKQKRSPIFVIIGNPPYNVGQEDENEANKNRKYKVLDRRLSETYGAESNASSTTKLNNAYVKAIRWASDRLGKEGVIALVTNNGFIRKRVFDGMRKRLFAEFTSTYVLDLGGDVRDNPKLSGTTHNVFGIQPGVSINFFVRNSQDQSRTHALYYAQTDEYWHKEQKYDFLESRSSGSGIKWALIQPSSDGTWLQEGLQADYNSFVSLVGTDGNGIFALHSLGVNTNRDAWTVNYHSTELVQNVRKLLITYNAERRRWLESPKKDLDKFLTDDGTKIKWSSSLKDFLDRNIEGIFVPSDVRVTEYRPFTRQSLYFNELLTHRRARLKSMFPTTAQDGENRCLCVPGPGNRRDFTCFVTKYIPALDFAFEKAQCFSIEAYDEDGNNRRENITDWALEQFRSHYNDRSITKWDIFYYTYAVLHHPEYRTRYAANLKRELPRIPYAPDFHAFAKAGKRLAELHVDYEKQKEYPLEQREKPGAKLDLRVEKMRLGKDKQFLIYNDFLTLTGIPKEVYDYRLGNRSALEWVIDQYQVSTDKRSGITNDPNRPDDPEYILRLIGQVITVSLETVNIVTALPELGLAKKQNKVTASATLT